jgi:hypothetical protein
MYCMRALVATVFSVSLLTVGAAASTTNAHVVRSHGISVALPQTWHLTDELLSVCTSPGQVMAITNSSVPIGKEVRKGVALILVLEDRYSKPSFFPPRRRFRLLPNPGLLVGCWDCETRAVGLSEAVASLCPPCRS